jgi:hypothetical protein
MPAVRWYQTPAGTWLADPEPGVRLAVTRSLSGRGWSWGVRRGMRMLAHGDRPLPSAAEARSAAAAAYAAQRGHR